MKWRPSWQSVVLALAVVAAIGVASPVLGISKSLRKSIKREVARQIARLPSAQPGAGASGAPGTPGVPGPPGAPGADGTARAYASVELPCNVNGCNISRDQGIESVMHLSLGQYCVVATGISAQTEVPALTVDFFSTPSPGNATVYTATQNAGCGPANAGFVVLTARQPSVAVRNAADNGSVNVAGNGALADDVGFTILIP